MAQGSDFSRLLLDQQKALVETEHEITTLTGFKTDYHALEERLQTLPHQIKHDIMVPIGSLAFMPGQLVHTNEVLVLLGDNWFAEVSAKQAVDVVKRRIQNLEGKIEDLTKQKGLLEPRLQFTNELLGLAENKDGVQEIFEELDEEAEKEWREKHRESVRRYKESERLERERLSQDELTKRLETLEIAEANQREVQDGGHDEDGGAQVLKRRISWLDQGDWEEVSTDEDADEVDEEDLEDEDHSADDGQQLGNPMTARIAVHHTVHSESVLGAHSDVTSVQTPADIYRVFQSAPHSILKTPTDEFPKHEWREKNDCLLRPDSTEQNLADQVQERKEAFSAVVVEKAAATEVEVLKGLELLSKHIEPKRRTSKFKSQRKK